MSRAELLIGKVLRVGLWLSVLIVLVGGIFYLIQYGHESVHYELFTPKFQPQSLMLSSSTIIIQLGLFVLILTQVLRVMLTAWLFLDLKDYVFTGISLVILGVLIYSIFWRS